MDQQVGRLPLKGAGDKRRNRSFMWTINIKDFNLADKCISREEIKNVAIVATGVDGWNIATITTFLEDAFENMHFLTEDINVFRWIDADGDDRRRTFDLTFRR